MWFCTIRGRVETGDGESVVELSVCGGVAAVEGDGTVGTVGTTEMSDDDDELVFWRF